MRFTYLSIFPENNVTYLPKIENEGCFTHIFLRNFTEWVIFSVILEHFIWRQKYFSQMSFVINSISGPQLSKWILCLERESCVGVRHHSPQSGLWASTIPVRSKVKISRKTCPMLRRKDSIHYGINGSLSIRFKSKAQCIIDQYNNYKVGNLSVNGINTQVTHFTFTFTFCLFGHFPLPPICQTGTLGHFIPQLILASSLSIMLSAVRKWQWF